MALFTTKQIARELGVTIGTVYRMVHAGIIPAIRVGVGRSLRFNLEHVKTSLTKQLSPPAIPRRKSTKDPLLTLHELAIETGIKDLAQHHDHYLYGIPIKPVVSSTKR